MNQERIALIDMKEWLMHPQELGKEPFAIEEVHSFELDNMTYYVFRFKANEDDPWLVSVCGGYSQGESQHCGHIFSKFENYEETTAIEKAKEMVEMLKEYWKQQAKLVLETKRQEEELGDFSGQILLASKEWNWDSLLQELAVSWQVYVETVPQGDCLTFKEDGMTVTLVYHSEKIQGKEIELLAARNSQWPSAVDFTRAHKAYLTLLVTGEESRLKKGELQVKVLSACSMQDNVLGVATRFTVFNPELYEELSVVIKKDQLPIYNWIYIDVYGTKDCKNAITYGCSQFGKKEMEVLNVKASEDEIRDFLTDIVYSVIESDIELKDGETITVAEKENLMVFETAGVAIDEPTLKIEYRK